MADDITIRPQGGEPASDVKKYRTKEQPVSLAENIDNQQLKQQAQGHVCASCGTVNDPEAMYCASCGKPLKMATCPNCGSEIDPDADFCEVCHRYIRTNVCSFCGTEMSPNEVYCHECGNPRGGIVCPVCNTLNEFSFCKQCGTPLTDEARQMVEDMRKLPEYSLLADEVRKLDELNMELPYTSERDVVRDQQNEELRMRVLTLLARDKGVTKPEIQKHVKKRLSKEELAAKKEDKLKIISDILSRMEVPALPSPIKARNYAMAQKPGGVRLAWVCNWKHAMHSSPCGCAKPQLGGKWVILGRKNNEEIKDDNK